MSKDLTNSSIERQNILNNKYALQRIQEYIGFTGMFFEGEYRFTKKMVAEFFQVDTSTIDRYLSSHETELKHNGYILTKGKLLKEFKLQFVHLINEANKTPQLGLFNFRSFLNLAMLLKESENAQLLRNQMLDIVIDTINQRTQGLLLKSKSEVKSWGVCSKKLKLTNYLSILLGIHNNILIFRIHDLKLHGHHVKINNRFALL